MLRTPGKPGVLESRHDLGYITDPCPEIWRTTWEKKPPLLFISVIPS